MEEERSLSEFLAKLADTASSLSSGMTQENAGMRLAAIDKLLAHHKEIVLGKEQIKANAASVKVAPNNGLQRDAAQAPRR